MESPNRRPVTLPLLAGTAACLGCPWTATGPNAHLAARSHRDETGHPIVTAPSANERHTR
ncbi:hypothetical protein ACNTMW_21075 [Planosporangium sp. 12N6]|uniref:hypothetical protein n=1 Tax=Planosporangium spinosum TaxID=3402278 RepID=UPI003CF3D9BD